MKATLVAGLSAAAVLLLQRPVDAGASASVGAVVPVADQLDLRATNIATAEGASISGPIATFTDSNTARPASAFSATVTWGDSATSTGTVSGGSGRFSVTASHVYAEEGAYPIRVVIQESPDGSTAGAAGTATISDAPLTAAGTRLTSGQAVRAVVATFTDADPGQRSSDYSAQITWGDGSQSAGIISAQGSGFAVSGSHRYGHPGSFTVTIAIADVGGAHTTATTRVSVSRD